MQQTPQFLVPISIFLESDHQLRGGGGVTKRERGGGASEVSPLQKMGAGKVVSILKGGTKSFWVVEGRGRKKCRTRDFPIV